MAIVKANFTRKRNQIKDILRYIIHRPDREAEKQTRTLFGRDRELTKAEAYALIDALKGSVYFHVILNFDQKREDKRRDIDLRAITRQAMATLEERMQRPIRFFGVEHNDHTDKRHIHAIAILKLGRGERIGRQDWQACRSAATTSARLERRAHDAVLGHQWEREQKRHFSKPVLTRTPGLAGGIGHTQPLQLTRPCGECENKNQMKRLKNGKYWCAIHGVEKEQSLELSR
jgi:hypothetical protein